MCGISGIYNFSGQQLPDAGILLQGMTNCLLHRGPDDEGIWTNNAGTIHFGHRRLSIIDLSAAGHQPMTDSYGNAIVYNGEIYNYKEIRSTITHADFSSDSDTEVLLELCRNKFKHAIDSINGMFAFAYWDETKQKLLLARDRMGKKPLFYTVSNGLLVFASEIKSILELPFIKREVNHEALYHFLTFNQVSAPLTLFKNIYKLPPAGYLVAGAGGIEEEGIWWDIEYQDLQAKTEKEITDDIYSLLKRSVQYRMVADVPVGAFLSGGVDSSAIVALMHEQGHKIKTYSAGFQGQPRYTELKHAEKIAKRYSTNHFETKIRPEDIRELMFRMAEIFDEPLADPTSIPIFFISRLARENGTIVVQTGDGSDELFSGYNNWMKYARISPYFGYYSQLPSIIRKGIAGVFSNERNYAPWKEFLHRSANNEEFFWGGAKSFKESSKKKFLKAKLFDGYNSHDVIKGLKQRFQNSTKGRETDYIDWMCYLGLKQQIPERYLYRMDKLGMANSVEVRCPFLDVNLVNYAMSVPSKYKIKDNKPKYILKKSLERILDKETLYRPKMGFNVPLREWSHEVMMEYINTNLHSFCKKSEVFDENGLQNMIAEAAHNKDLSNNLFTIYFLMAWYDKWIH